MPIHLLIKLLAGSFSIWLVLIWSDNLPHPAWLKDDTESLLAIPAALLWIVGYWEEVENFFRKKIGADTPPAAPPSVQVTVQNIFPPSPAVGLPKEGNAPALANDVLTRPPSPEALAGKNDPMTNDLLTNDAPAHTYSSGNRLILSPDDPILDPLLGKPLLGRATEIEALHDLLDHSQTDVQVVHLLVLAEGGVGKTELCKAALRRYLRTHPHKKAWFVSLEAATTLSDLWQRMAAAIGLDNLRSEAELLAALPEGIYYLDNLESLSEVPRLAQHLRHISQKPGLRLLASSRYEVPGWGKTFDLHTLPAPAAVDLFREIWAESGAQPIPPDAPELEKFVCDDLGCLPLAVVLVAALGRYEGTLPAVMRRWHTEGAAAAQRPGAAPDQRLDSLQHSMRLSFTRLSQPARLLWGLAAFFPAGLPLDYFEWLLNRKPTWKEKLLRFLLPSKYPKLNLREGRDQLLLHRILHRQPDNRLKISPPLARFARDLSMSCEPGFEAGALFSRLAPWLQALGDAADSDREGRAIARLLEEFPTMEAAALFFTAQPALPEGPMPLLRAWQNFYWRRIFLGKKILDATLACAPKLPDGDHAWALKYSGDLAGMLGENAESRSRYDAALPLFEKVGSDLGKANTLQSLGDLALRLGENAESRSRYDAALPLFEKVGDDLGKANTLRSLGDLARMLGENAESRSRYDAALPLYEKVGSDLGKANTLQSLGDLEKALDNQAAAQATWAAALLLYQKVGEPMGEGYCHVRLARVAHAAGEAAVAQEHLRLARACSEKVGNPHLAGQVEALAKELG